MSHKQLRNHKSQENTLVEISCFEPTEGVAEYHVMIHVTRPSLTYQSNWILCSIRIINCWRMS